VRRQAARSHRAHWRAPPAGAAPAP
jgi:hypothetical protein